MMPSVTVTSAPTRPRTRPEPLQPGSAARLARRALLLGAALLLAACVEEGGSGATTSTATVTRAQVGDRNFYLQHHYVNDARTNANIARVNQSLSNFMQGFSNSASFIGEQIRLGEINSTDPNARFVNRDKWRAVVVSQDNIARSIVRIHNQTSDVTCTGFFVAPHLIATSAHCFRLGDALGAFRQNATNGRAFMTREEEYFRITHQYENSLYDRSKKCDPNDIALLLTERPSQNYLPITKSPLCPGQRLMVIGYSGDLNQGYFLRIDYGCKVTGIGPQGFVGNDCASFPGNSGGPQLTATDTIAAAGVVACGPVGTGDRAPGRNAASVQRMAPMLAGIRTRPEAQGRRAAAPY